MYLFGRPHSFHMQSRLQLFTLDASSHLPSTLDSTERAFITRIRAFNHSSIPYSNTRLNINRDCEPRTAEQNLDTPSILVSYLRPAKLQPFSPSCNPLLNLQVFICNYTQHSSQQQLRAHLLASKWYKIAKSFQKIVRDVDSICRNSLSETILLNIPHIFSC